MNLAAITRIEIGDRGSGKTFDMMDEMHNIMVERRGRSVLLVLADHSRLTWWRDQWRDRFPGMGLPQYITLTSLLAVRGMQADKVYIEDVDDFQEGIYDKRLTDIWPVFSHSPNPEIIVTFSPIDENQLPYSITPGTDLRNRLRSFQFNKEVSSTS